MTGEARIPVFELHIRPMFRLLGQQHMTTLVQPAINLWDLDAVWANRTEILERLKGQGLMNMPGEKVGGPWPPEWVALFERWVATGSNAAPSHHLGLVKPDGPYDVQQPTGTQRRLIAIVTAPTKGCRVWFELDAVSSEQRDYTLSLEPAFPAQPANPTVIRASDLFPKGTVTKVVIRDADGTHELDVP